MEQNGHGYNVNTVDGSDVLGLLKTCGAIVIDVSRDEAALSKGKALFRSFKGELVGLKGDDKTIAAKTKKLIVVISTIMTWAGSADPRVSAL